MIKMRKTFVLGLFLILVLMLGACSSDFTSPEEKTPSSTETEEADSSVQENEAENTEEQSEINEVAEEAANGDEEGTTMVYAHIGDAVLEILPSGNSSSDALIELLSTGDLTVDMHDYANFEKVGAIGTSLPRNDEQITTEAGDVILYQGNSIVIYYDQNSWNFTRLGKVQGLPKDELKEILGDGDVTVIFSLTP